MYSCEYYKISKRTFLHRTPLVVASENKPNISNTNLNKNQKMLFLYFDNSHAKRTNTTKKMSFLKYIVNISENLKKTNEKKWLYVVMSHMHFRVNPHSTAA